MSRAIYTAKQFIDAIPGTGGIITTIAKRVGCVWHTAKKHIDEYPTVKQAYDDETETIADLAEVGLIKALKAEDGSMIRFYLTTKARHRGYVVKQEVDVTSKGGRLGSVSDEERLAAGASFLDAIRARSVPADNESAGAVDSPDEGAD